VNTVLDTNHRWLVWFQPIAGDPRVVGAFDDRRIAEVWASGNSRRTAREHLAWLPTTMVRVMRAGIDVRPGQVYPASDELLVCGPEVVGRGIVVDVSQDEFTVAVPVIPPGLADGPSLWEIGHCLGQPVQA
jgi:hypothetical protein